jgi:hypothetical protein
MLPATASRRTAHALGSDLSIPRSLQLQRAVVWGEIEKMADQSRSTRVGPLIMTMTPGALYVPRESRSLAVLGLADE